MGAAEGGGGKAGRRCFLEPPPLREPRLRGRGEKGRSPQKAEKGERAGERNRKRKSRGLAQEVGRRRTKRKATQGDPPAPEQAAKESGLGAAVRAREGCETSASPSPGGFEGAVGC